MKCRRCIYLRGLRCVIIGRHVHGGLGPKCKFYTESVLDEKLKGNDFSLIVFEEGACTGSTEKKTGSK